MAIARVRLIKKAPNRSPLNPQANAQDDGWDQALDAVHTALGTPTTAEQGVPADWQAIAPAPDIGALSRPVAGSRGVGREPRRLVRRTPREGALG